MRTLVLTVACALMLIARGQGAVEQQIGPFDSTVKAASAVSRGVGAAAVLTLPKIAGKYSLVVLAHGHCGSKDENGGFTAIAR
jgi:hypothetical protein